MKEQNVVTWVLLGVSDVVKDDFLHGRRQGLMEEAGDVVDLRDTTPWVTADLMGTVMEISRRMPQAGRLAATHPSSASCVTSQHIAVSVRWWMCRGAGHNLTHRGTTPPCGRRVTAIQDALVCRV